MMSDSGIIECCAALMTDIFVESNTTGKFDSNSGAQDAVSMLDMTLTTESTINTTQILWEFSRSPKSGFLKSDDIQASIRVVLSNIVQVIIAVIGVLSNTINIVVFSKIGYSDSVSVALLGLAVSDLGYLLLSTVSQGLDILDSSVGLRPLEPLKHVAYQVLWWNNMFYDITIFITVFNAVQKCACVAIPLIFKSIFTRFRACIVVGSIYVALLVYYMPTFAHPGKKTVYDPVLKWTRLGYYYQPDNDTVYSILHMFSRIILPFLSQVVVLFCTVILTIKLRAAARKRRSMANFGESSESLADLNLKSSDNSSRKELRAIQTVTLISAIFVVCNMPDILITFTSIFFPQFDDAMKYESTYKMCSAIQDIFAVTYSTINIAVYLKFNSKYRRTFMEIMGTLRCCRHRLTSENNLSNRKNQCFKMTKTSVSL